MSDDVPYLMRGVRSIATDSSVLVSSSSYLNSLDLREWLPFIMLRRNGPDLPLGAEMAELARILPAAQELDQIAALFAGARLADKALDAWLNERRWTAYTLDALAQFGADTLGAAVRAVIEAEDGAPPAADLPPDASDYIYFRQRTRQNEVVERILLGAPPGHFGRLLQHYVSMSNLFQHVDLDLAGAVGSYHLFGAMRFVPRAVLHYPDAWPAVQACIEQGIELGERLPPLFRLAYEDVLPMSVDMARRKLGIEPAPPIDTVYAEAVWNEHEDPMSG